MFRNLFFYSMLFQDTIYYIDAQINVLMLENLSLQCSWST